MVKSTIERPQRKNIIQEQREVLKNSRKRTDDLMRRAEALGVQVNNRDKAYSSNEKIR